jgi:hypothetical protein
MEAFEQWAASQGCALIALATRRAAPFNQALGTRNPPPISAKYWSTRRLPGIATAGRYGASTPAIRQADSRRFALILLTKPTVLPSRIIGTSRAVTDHQAGRAYADRGCAELAEDVASAP